MDGGMPRGTRRRHHDGNYNDDSTGEDQSQGI
jgi:hypothetical protein